MAVHQLTFRVSLPDNELVGEGNSVFVTGNSPVLGSWQANGSLRMSQVDDRRWSVTAPATASVDDALPCAKRRKEEEEEEAGGRTLEYRYFVGKALKDGRVCVRRWESDREPRRMVLEKKGTVCEDTFGLGQQAEPLDVSEGWLQCETMVQILVHPTKQQPISLQYKGPIRLHFQQQQREGSGGLLDVQPMHVKVLDVQTGDCESPDQSDAGVLFDEKKVMVAVATTDDYENTVYYIDVYSAEGDVKRLGRCFVTHHMLSDPSQSGCLDLPVVGEGGSVVGNVAVGYTVVRPCECPLVHSMKKGGELRVWKEVGVLMGHRGLGATIGYGSRDLAHPENTIASFKEAAKQGADWIEFDLLMSKDGHLFVDHSITATVAIETKSGKCSLRHNVSLADFTLEELQSMKILDPHCPAEAHEGVSKYLSDVTCEEENLFPTLQQVFDAIPPEVGLDLDVKYTLPCDDGRDCFPYLDRNKYADAVLREVYRLGANRRIIFTCLDLDLALCLHHKQPHYAVIYCTNGGFKAWAVPLDRRAASYEGSLAFCVSEGLSIVSPSHTLVEDHSLVVKTRASGVALFLHGEHTGEEKHREELARLGVNGFIVDGIADHLPCTQ